MCVLQATAFQLWKVVVITKVTPIRIPPERVLYVNSERKVPQPMRTVTVEAGNGVNINELLFGS